MKDFQVSKFYTYNGPNYYLDTRAVVFNLFLDPGGPMADFYHDAVTDKFPRMKEDYPSKVVDLFVQVLINVMKMDINLFINKYSISYDGEEYEIAVEYLDDQIAEDCVYFVCDWLASINEGQELDFQTEFAALQMDFDKTLFGGPTLYSLIEAGLKRGIPVSYLYEENCFQWGYGKKSVRGRSTTLHIDSIRDTEFTMYKDMVKDFLLMCGFPTPVGKNCYTEKDILKEAESLGFPVVVKPLAGHKGQGVTTNIESAEEVSKAFHNIEKAAKELGVPFDGAIVEQQIYGTDHRLLSVRGKFAAALQRVPAYVDGNGTDNIEKLIEKENDKEVRLDNARSPLTKIKIDEDLKDYLQLQNLSLQSVPKEGERIFLRRVANISAGGVSINVTEKIHPKNIKLVEDIAKFFNVVCLGIDVLCEDISKPWNEGNFGIIEINAGPGVFMHLAPAIGGSIDVPGIIMESLFADANGSKIPIISGNNISTKFGKMLYDELKNIKSDIEYGFLSPEGVFFNNEFLCNNKLHSKNMQIIMRNPKLEFALLNHDKDDILDYGMGHAGSDAVILENPHYAEKVLERDINENSFIFRIEEQEILVYQNGEEKAKYSFADSEERDIKLLEAVKPVLLSIMEKYCIV